jgi:acyl-CoA hydrolase
MSKAVDSQWKKLLVTPGEVLDKIRPGMNIFLGGGSAEPRTLMKCLMESDQSNARDLELIQLGTHGDILSLKALQYQNYRLKTLFSGWVAGETATSQNVDLVPGRYSRIPRIIKSKRIPIDAAFIQITPPNESGYCSLGVAVDVAREAMEQASLVVGEINPLTPFTFGDTIVSISDFDLLVESTQKPA